MKPLFDRDDFICRMRALRTERRNPSNRASDAASNVLRHAQLRHSRDPNLLCINNACVTLTATKHSGETCGGGVECIKAGCFGDNFGDTPPFTCASKLGQGETCDPAANKAQDPFCGDGLRCYARTCEYMPPGLTCN